MGIIHRLVYRTAVLAVAVFAVAVYGGHYAQADAGPCSLSVTPLTFSPTASTDFNITVTNNGSNTIRWVNIGLPDILVYSGNNISGWSTADQPSGVVAYGGAIAPGGSHSFNLQVYGELVPGEGRVTAQASDDVGGASPAQCADSQLVSLAGHPNFGAAAGISGIVVDPISETSARVQWQSDNPVSSFVYYGTSDDYGRTSLYDAAVVTDHSVTLSGLSAGTTYHFQVAGSDGAGTFQFSSDNTFMTKPSVTPPPHSGFSVPSTAPLVVPPAQKTETTPPALRVNTRLIGAYQQAPQITGEASDNIGILKVEYSVDGGKNWLTITGGNGLLTPFSFTPYVSEDGDYPLTIRAIDISGNSTVDAMQTLVIDRMPPTVGGVVLQAGIQTISPQSDGVYRTAVGTEQDIIASAAGGATAIGIVATPTSTDKAQTFQLTRSDGTGLWTGALTFHTAGTYHLSAHALDGAGNQTQRDLFDIIVQEQGVVSDVATKKPVAGVIVTVYTKDSETNTWVPWDGRTYDQNNPTVTDTTGHYATFLPAGTYYLKLQRGGYRTVVSRQFHLAEPRAVSVPVAMARTLAIGNSVSAPTLPVWTVQPVVAAEPVRPAKTALAGTPLPDFSLPLAGGGSLQAADLLGKPSLLCFVATWSPSSQDQLAALALAAKQEGINVVAVAVGENAEKVNAYLRLGDYRLRAAADADNTLAIRLGVAALPTHLFVDRHGTIRTAVGGVLSAKEVINTILISGN